MQRKADASPRGESRRGGLGRYLLVAVPLTAGLGVVGLALYFYLHQREEYFLERYVRAVAALAEQTEGTIEGLDSAVDGAVKTWVASHSQGGEPKASGGPATPCAPAKTLTRQLELIPLRLSSPLPPGARTFDGAPPGVLARSQVRRLQETRSSRRRMPTTIEQPAVDTADATLYFCREIPVDARRLVANSSCERLAPEGWICAEQELGTLLEPLVKGSPLDQLDLFIVDEHGTTLYERGTSGLRLAALQRTRPAATGATAEGLPSLEEVAGTTIVRQVPLGDTTYLLFSQPMRLRARNTTQYRTWAIGALVPMTTLQSEARRMPTAVMLGVPVACLLAVLALPLLKVLTAAPRERLSRRTVVGVALAVTLSTAFATAAVLTLYAHAISRARVDDELRLFAHQLQASFRKEVRAAYKMLTDFSARRQQQLGQVVPDHDVLCNNVLDPTKAGCQPSHGSDGSKESIPAAPRPEEFHDVFRTYPSFDMLVLVDRDGRQREKWAVEDTNTPLIDVKQYSAFEDPMDGQTMRLRHTAGSRPAGRATPRNAYALNVQMSPNTGKQLTVFSVPIWNEATEPDAANKWNRWPPPDGVAMMVPRLLSVDDVVPPPGVGFAIIQPNGRVVFHSNDRHRLYENFFAETSADTSLRAALFVSRAGFFDLEYHGAPKRVFAGPMANTQWSLVVFRDVGPLRTATLQTLALTGIGILAVTLLCATWLLLARGLLGRRTGASLWPDPNATARYWAVLGALVVIGGWFVAMLAWGDGMARLLVTITVPLVALGIILLAMSVGHTDRWRWLLWCAVVTGLAATLATIGGLVAGWIWMGIAPWAVVAALVVLALAAWTPAWLSGPVRGTFLTPYIGIGVALLVIVAVLPTASVFLDAFALNARAVGRARQLALVERMQKQRESRWHRYRLGGHLLRDFLRDKRWDDSGLIAFWRAAVSASAANGRGSANGVGATQPAPEVHPVAARVFSAIGRSNPQVCGDGPLQGPPCRTVAAGQTIRPDLAAERCQLFARHFTAPMAALLPVFDDHALQLRHAAHPHATDCIWSTTADDRLVAGMRFTRDLSATTDTNGGGPNGPVAAIEGKPSTRRIPSPTITLSWPTQPLARGILVLGAMIIAWVVWYGLRGLAHRLFCLDAWMPRPAARPGLPLESVSPVLTPPLAVLPRGGGEASYRNFWHGLDQEERLVLYHLARDGFVQARNRDTVARLLRLGIVQRTPALRLADPGFRRFVRHAESPATIRHWEHAGGIGTWAWVRGSLVALIVLVGGFIYLTHPDSYAQWLGLVPALVTAIGSLGQVLGIFSGGSPRRVDATPS